MKHSFPISNIANTNRLTEVDPIVRNNKSYDETRYIRPSIESTAEILFAADKINAHCFKGRIPEFIVSYIQKKNVPSHFQPNRFQRADGDLVHGLAFNSTLQGIRNQKDSLTTIGYELTRLARYEFGPINQRGGRGSNGYHDKPWAMLAESIGLQPSDTGLPNGKITGSKMSYYLIEGGPLEIAIQELLDIGFRINWHDRLTFQNIGATDNFEEEIPAPKKDRIKFTCKNCGLNAWAKPSARLKCESCDLLMLADGSTPTNLIKTNERITP